MDRSKSCSLIVSIVGLGLAFACGCGKAHDDAHESAEKPQLKPKAEPKAEPKPKDAAVAVLDDEDAGAEGDGGSSAVPQFGTPVQVAGGFTLAEGPLWDPCTDTLLFTDVTASVVHTLSPAGDVGVLMKDTNNANGLAFDVDGSLILAQMGGQPGHVARRTAKGTVTQVDPAGSMLHTPDDVTVGSDGTIYFTDGDFPPIGGFDLSSLPVYALKPDSKELINLGTVEGPNGIELSPDETALYVDAYFAGNVVRFDLAADGTASAPVVVASGLFGPDSLCLDAAGNLYVGVSAGLQVLRPDGTPIALIPVASTQGVTNCAFGGNDGKTLYITAWTAVWKLEGMPIPGLDWQVNRKRVKC